jgi:hypothetical protein
MADRPAAHILVSVWDAPFIDKFVDFALATQLSPGNIPALSKQAQIFYHIYTNAESEAYVRQRTDALAPFAEIIIHTFEDTVFKGESIARRLAPYNGGAFKNVLNQISVFHLLDEIAGDNSQPVLPPPVLPPPVLFVCDSDMLYSDGAFPIMFNALQTGKKAVVAPTIRLSQEKSQDALAAILAAGKGVDARALGGLIASYPHAATINSYFLDGFAPAYPSQMAWPVEHGLLCRTFFPHPVAMIPNPDCRRWESTIDYDFILHCYPIPEDLRMFTDGETLTICKLSADSYLEGKMSRSPLNTDVLADFLLSSTNEAHRPFAECAVRYGVDPNTPELDQAERDSAALLREIYDRRDTLLDRVASDNPVKHMVVRSHFGPIEGYLSPERVNRMRRDGLLPTGA